MAALYPFSDGQLFQILPVDPYSREKWPRAVWSAVEQKLHGHSEQRGRPFFTTIEDWVLGCNCDIDRVHLRFARVGDLDRIREKECLAENPAAVFTPFKALFVPLKCFPARDPSGPLLPMPSWTYGLIPVTKDMARVLNEDKVGFFPGEYEILNENGVCEPEAVPTPQAKRPRIDDSRRSEYCR